MNKKYSLLVIFCVHIVVVSVAFILSSGSVQTLFLGANLGIGVTGAVLYGQKCLKTGTAESSPENGVA